MDSPVAAELAALWAAGWPYLHLETVEEDRAFRIAQEVAAARQAELFTWSATGGLSGAPQHLDPLAALDAIAASPGRALVLLHDLHRWLDDRRLVRRLRDLARPLSLLGKCLVICAPPFDPPEELVPELARVELPPPGRPELEAILDGAASLAQVALEPAHREAIVAAALGLTEEEGRRAFSRALADPAVEPVAAVLGEKRRRLSRSALEVVEAAAVPALDEVGGLESLKAWLAERAGAFTVAARAFGLPAPRGLLLLGVQGCGKSLTAKAVARWWQLPLLRLDVGTLFGQGSPEAALRRTLRAAEAVAPCALWIDEIEKGLAGADPARGDGGGAGARVLGSFATWLQEKQAPVFVVATANEVAALPPEVLRRGRFDEIFFVDLPDERARGEILGIHLRARGRDPARFSVGPLARSTEHFSGAELEQVVVAALYRAFAAGRELADDDLRRTAADTVPLFRTYEERVKALRAWAKDRARPAARTSAGVVDLLSGGGR